MTKFMRKADSWGDSTRGFYEKHAAEYAATTLKLSMRTAMDEFARDLDRGTLVVDLGCGAGRDLRALRARDFSATGVDWAFSIAAIARHYSGCPTVVADLRELPFKEAVFHGAWASASLLHLRRQEVALAIAEACRVLRPGGILFASVKGGRGEIRDREGRWFTLFEPDEWADLLAANGFAEHRVVSDAGIRKRDAAISEGPNGSWITSFSRRTSMSANEGRRHGREIL